MKYFINKKNISHWVYKRARLFDVDNGQNLAYDYAMKHLKDKIQNKIFHGKIDINGELQEDDNEEETNQNIQEEKIELYKQLLTKWNLDYITNFEQIGYDDVNDWKELDDETLSKKINMKDGHIKKFKRYVKEYFEEQEKEKEQQEQEEKELQEKELQEKEQQEKEQQKKEENESNNNNNSNNNDDNNNIASKFSEPKKRILFKWLF